MAGCPAKGSAAVRRRGRQTSPQKEELLNINKNQAKNSPGFFPGAGMRIREKPFTRPKNCDRIAWFPRWSDRWAAALPAWQCSIGLPISLFERFPSVPSIADGERCCAPAFTRRQREETGAPDAKPGEGCPRRAGAARVFFYFLRRGRTEHTEVFYTHGTHCGR